ncbi:MAG: adenylate/guanylate cyclase domain-containing protein [Candidatus Limnocylindria bacterium]
MEDPGLAAAREALGRHAWREAFDTYRDAEASGARLEPDDLEQLAQAAWWISRIDDCLSARERAYAAFMARGDKRRAAYEAVWLARDNLQRRRTTTGMSWLKRAEALLEGEPDSVEHAYLDQTRSFLAAGRGDLEEAVARAARAVELGARFGDRDIQARALTNQGEALVMLGRLDEGMALFDEATVAAVGGELSPMATGIVYCNTIGVCAEIADFGRAAEWTEAAKRWCERQAISGFPGVCRVHRAEVVRLRGAWSEAEREARVAAEELTEHGTLGYAAAAFKEVGEIRLRMGDDAAAEEAFRLASELGEDPEPGLALLQLAKGNSVAAASQIRRAQAETGQPLARARLLPAVVEIALATNDRAWAQSAADELLETADRYGTAMFHALAAHAGGAVLLANDDAASAVDRLRDSVRRWREIEAPYEMAGTRELLGRAYRASGDEHAAVMELDAARATFERLGAARDLARVSRALGREPETTHRVTRTFMFTDIVGSTNLIETVGDDAWNDLRHWHDQVLRAAFAAHRGEEVDHAGDGFFVAFPDAAGALECAVGIQRLLAEHRHTHGFAPRVRIGVHVDAATQAGAEYHGRGVHMAARIGSQAEGGEVLASQETVAAAQGRWKASEPRDVQLKGISRPVRVVSVEWR